MNTTPSRVMYMAHHIYSNDHKITLPLLAHHEVRSWSECMRMAWYFIRFRKALTDGIVKFSFFKKDGSIREARATLHPTLIPADKMPKDTLPLQGKGQERNYSAIAFFDLDKQEWRSFSIANFIGFVSAYKLTENHFNQ